MPPSSLCCCVKKYIQNISKDATLLGLALGYNRVYLVNNHTKSRIMHRCTMSILCRNSWNAAPHAGSDILNTEPPEEETAFYVTCVSNNTVFLFLYLHARFYIYIYILYLSSRVQAPAKLWSQLLQLVIAIQSIGSALGEHK